MALLLLLPVVLLVGGAFLLAHWSERARPIGGLVHGRLRPPPPIPNYVCSESGTPEDRAVPALALTGAADAAWVRLRTQLIEAGGRIEQETADYIWATFRTPAFGFVDDVEIRLDRQAAVIHVRSASRVGRSDLGVNRRRVERLRSRFSGAGESSD
jgi:uncharacterized protein (DUF1499 family)